MRVLDDSSFILSLEFLVAVAHFLVGLILLAWYTVGKEVITANVRTLRVERLLGPVKSLVPTPPEM
jgi:hypothetical protein